MNLRKSTYFKPLCLLVAALFTVQCVSIERKLISTEKKVIENGSQGYVYELEKVKTPSVQDPTIEYRIVKFPANRAESVNTYKLRKVNGILCILLGCVTGAYYGSKIGYNSSINSCDQMGPVFLGILIGSVTGTIVGALAGKTIGIKTDKGIIKVPTKTYLKKKPDSMSIPLPNIPLEFKWGTGGKSNSFKTQTDEQGIVRINLVDDLKITKFPPAQPFTLYIHYLNPQSQKNAIFGDSLEPEK